MPFFYKLNDSNFRGKIHYMEMFALLKQVKYYDFLLKKCQFITSISFYRLILLWDLEVNAQVKRTTS